MTPQAKIVTQAVATRRVTRRYWRLREKRGGWWPWGWLLLLALLLVFLYGLFVTAPAIEVQTAERVGQVLTERGVGDFKVETDGQEVLIRAAGSEADAERIRGWARDAACDTWVASALVCPTSVRVEMQAAAPAAPPPIPEPPLVKRPHDFRLVKADGSIVLSGEVPDAKTRDELVAAAKSRFASVTDELRISGERSTDAYGWASERALLILSVMQSGNVDWTEGRLSAKGWTSAANEAEVRRVFASTDHPERLGAIDLQITEAADRCNKEFAERLATATIRFQTGSAEIAPDSRSLIAELAELAKACPIGLAVDGHTDNAGPEQLNRELSQARAEAVAAALVSLGVEAARLTPRGFGADQPIADNATAAGRAQNRRIEIRAMGSQTK